MKKIYNIPAGEDFPKTLAAFLLDKAQQNPEKLTQCRVLLPTRRACRVLHDSFLQLTNGRPMLLPRMASIGDVEEQDLSLLMFEGGREIMDIPPAIPALKRQLLLAHIIMAMPGFAQGKVHALSLANALSRFMDKVIVEGLDFSDLHKIVPEEFANYWQITLEFLKIIGEEWPRILQAEHCVDAATRRNILLHALAEHWRDSRPENPIIVAGSTGSIPATRNLLSVVSGLSQGQIILPGLDAGIDEESWNVLAESHPQYGLKNLLDDLGVDRGHVKVLGQAQEQTILRGKLATEIVRPAQTTHMWKEFAAQDGLQEMLHGAQYFECDTQQEEAQLISVLVRETLDQEAYTVALITPDRKLARRVVALCRRWGIEADDSGGEILSESRVGQFLLLSLKAASVPFDSYALLAFLKHVLCHAGYENEFYHDLVSRLETEFLRSRDGVYSYEALMGLAAQDKKYHSVAVFITKIYEALSDLIKIANFQQKSQFIDILKIHILAAEFFAAKPGEAGADVLWCGDDGEAAASFLNDLRDHAEDIGDVTFEEYEEIFSHLMSQSTVRSPYGLHPRLAILGQIEARLTSADLIVMSGLNEGTWPSLPAHDPWMSRTMRRDFGLPTDERSIGLAAHDFVQAFCAKNIVMTRSRRRDGSPASPARWLQRLETVLKAGGTELSALSHAPYLAWARRLDWTEEFMPCERPKPCPPSSVRPSRVSVTRIENWLRDPYMIYAHYVLNLRKLNPLMQQTDVTTKGKILHGILERFHRACPYDIPPNAEEIMVGCAKEELEARGIRQDELGFWWPRFYRLCAWFLAHEREWRARAKFLKTEAKGEIALSIDGKEFRLSGIADRIDRMHGGYAIVDYKSGGTFSGKALKDGKLPQLPLEALIAQCGGFESIEAGSTQYMGYWKMTGGAKAGELTEIEGDLDEVIKTVEEGLIALVRAFRAPDMPFFSIPDPANAPRFNDYEHLARVKEWAALDNEAQEWEE